MIPERQGSMKMPSITTIPIEARCDGVKQAESHPLDQILTFPYFVDATSEHRHILEGLFDLYGIFQDKDTKQQGKGGA